MTTMLHQAGRFKLARQLVADEVRYVFGNPGTVEEGLLDALGDSPEIEYILGLQEGVAVGAADGYARAAQRPAVVQLHSGVGLANGTSLLYQAKRGRSPLVVLAGEAGLAYDAMEAQNHASLVDIARPFVKYAARVVHPSSLLRVVRRAIKIAATPPMGPVFVALPLDVLDAPCDEEIVKTEIPTTRVAPEHATIHEAATLLLAAERPLFIVGDGVAAAGAQPELARLAEAVGARVVGADSSEVNLPADHPLWRGLLGHMFGSASAAVTTTADVVLICGTYVFPEVFPALSGAFAPGAKLIGLDVDAHEIGKNFPLTLGMLADPKLTLAAIAEAVEVRSTTAHRLAAAGRREAAAVEGEAERREAARLDRSVRASMPLQMARFAEELASLLPKDAVVFDEAITNSPALCRHLPPIIPGSYFQTRGGSLGDGIPGAIGAKLARPDKTVIGVVGDGGAMYTIQALWTAAHHRIGAKFVVCSNGGYRILEDNLEHYWSERGVVGRPIPPSFRVREPEIRFDQMARSMGVDAARVERPEQIRPALRRALADDRPFLIDLVLEKSPV